MVDISKVNEIVNQLTTGGHHLVEVGKLFGNLKDYDESMEDPP